MQSPGSSNLNRNFYKMLRDEMKQPIMDIARIDQIITISTIARTKTAHITKRSKPNLSNDFKLIFFEMSYEFYRFSFQVKVELYLVRKIGRDRLAFPDFQNIFDFSFASA